MYKNKPEIFLVRLLDNLRKKWESTDFMRLVATVLVVSYIGALVLIGLKQIDFFKDYLYIIPDNPFKLIETAFALADAFSALIIFIGIIIIKRIEKPLPNHLYISINH
jgi:hypothetical protein